MGNIVREIVGWVLIVLGLLAFQGVFSFLNQRQVVEGGIVCSIGFIIFRGGIHLIKVSLAARAVQQVASES